MKLYVVKGFFIDKKQSSITDKKVDSFIAYFTNLKEVYKQFDDKTVHSYSTVANRIKEEGYYSTIKSKFLIDEKMVKFHQIRIERVLANKVYNNFNYINLNQLIAQRLSDFKF
jgi:hypothetical protein